MAFWVFVIMAAINGFARVSASMEVMAWEELLEQVIRHLVIVVAKKAVRAVQLVS